jgi:hypothetical protein
MIILLIILSLALIYSIYILTEFHRVIKRSFEIQDLYYDLIDSKIKKLDIMLVQFQSLLVILNGEKK